MVVWDKLMRAICPLYKETGSPTYFDNLRYSSGYRNTLMAPRANLFLDRNNAYDVDCRKDMYQAPAGQIYVSYYRR